MTKLQAYFEMFLPLIEAELKTMTASLEPDPGMLSLMVKYHMGWVDEDGKEINSERGKRIRPVLCLLAAEAAGGEMGKALPAAVSLELVHNFSLLHDDIEDRSIARRGRKTVWAIWGENQAINTGDAMMALAFKSIVKLGKDVVDESTQVRLISLLSRTCLDLTHGQHLDMLFETRDIISPDAYLEMIDGKTSAMLSASASMGGISAGADSETIEKMAMFGRYLGLAFQLQDDILDIWGDPSVTGKERAVDIRQRKKTYPVILGLKRNAALHQYYDHKNELSDAEVSDIISLLDASDAHHDTELLVTEYSEKALECLQDTSLIEDASNAMKKLVSMLMKRDK